MIPLQYDVSVSKQVLLRLILLIELLSRCFLSVFCMVLLLRSDLPLSFVESLQCLLVAHAQRLELLYLT